MNKTLSVSTAFLTRAVQKGFVCCFLLLLGVVTAIASPSPAFAVSPGGFADIVFVVDESGSMGGEHEWLKDAVVDLEAALKAANVGTRSNNPNRYGMVGFGWGSRGTDLPEDYLIGGGKFGSSSDLVAAMGDLRTTGSFEDGYAGMNEALDYPFRQGASVNIILVTDEDRDISDSSLTYQTILSKLAKEGGLLNQGALLNAVVNSRLESLTGKRALGIDGDGNVYLPDGNGSFDVGIGGTVVTEYGNTKADYSELAWDTRSGIAKGAVWDLNLVEADKLTVESFSSAFTEAKVKEILGSSVVPLGRDPGVFEVCADNEEGTRVFTVVNDGNNPNAADAASLYNFKPDNYYDPWFTGELDVCASGVLCDYEGDASYPRDNLTYSTWDAFSLVVEDGLKGSTYQISRTPQLPMYVKDYSFFKMNDKKGQYDDNFMCIRVDYEYVGPAPN